MKSNYFFIGYLRTNNTIITAMIAGKSENSDHIMLSTESVIETGSTIVLPMLSVVMLAPASPKKRATSEPEIAVPNFCDIVPDEKIRPVDELPFFSVA